MFSKLKAAWARMTGGRAAGESDEPDTPAIEAIQSVASSSGIEVNPVSVRDAGEIERAVAALKFATPQSKQGRTTAWTISSHDLSRRRH